MGMRDPGCLWHLGIQSDLTEFLSLDDLATTNSPERLNELTFEKLKEHLSHRELRILHQAQTAERYDKTDSYLTSEVISRCWLVADASELDEGVSCFAGSGKSLQINRRGQQASACC